MTLFAAVTGSEGAFSSFVDSALGKSLSPPFTPYDSNLDFLFGAFILEDVLVTAYEVRAPDICGIRYAICVQYLRISGQPKHALCWPDSGSS